LENSNPSPAPQVPTTEAAPIVTLEGPSPAVPIALEETTGKSKPSTTAVLRETLETLLLALIIFFGVKEFVLQNFRVEGQSMEPNFHTGQYLIVDKIGYRLHTVERGDVIVFVPPKDASRDFIKRVIALPGERVEIRQGHVLINGKLLQEPYIKVSWNYTMAPIVVGEDEYFVLGDNRNNSSDSRMWGLLPKKNIVGKAWLSYWPPQQWGLIPRYALALQGVP
jgi:signal peptidase I